LLRMRTVVAVDGVECRPYSQAAFDGKPDLNQT
jgi:hypothetical protein